MTLLGLTRGYEADAFLRAVVLTGERHVGTNTVQVAVPLATAVGGRVLGWIPAEDVAEALGW